MAKWVPFTPEELKLLAAQGLHITQTDKMNCPHCGSQAMCVYLHDLSERKTAEWLWCADCKRFTHHCVAALSCSYSYNDPLADGEYASALNFSGEKWYDFLQTLYDSGILPQRIAKK